MLRLIFLFLPVIALADYNATLNAQQLGLYYQDYNFLMGLTGLLCGVAFMSIVLYLIAKVAGGR